HRTSMLCHGVRPPGSDTYATSVLLGRVRLGLVHQLLGDAKSVVVGFLRRLFALVVIGLGRLARPFGRLLGLLGRLLRRVHRLLGVRLGLLACLLGSLQDLLGAGGGELLGAL